MLNIDGLLKFSALQFSALQFSFYVCDFVLLNSALFEVDDGKKYICDNFWRPVQSHLSSWF